ncbi:hypothetical protein BDU57DRAFT_68877 [Ampelomyces quisqualis]|uniref:Uncharacterized protein n=1 Tax=Ampelomyces quisqualis TaxID=50730 RepID=A0A6A5R4B0_AMPQU|nr:hypothetical protein BDU57DRAFT_68877 [Ampelomyces quisqualis]
MAGAWTPIRKPHHQFLCLHTPHCLLARLQATSRHPKAHSSSIQRQHHLQSPMPHKHPEHVGADRGDYPGVPVEVKTTTALSRSDPHQKNSLESHEAPQSGAPATRPHNAPVAFTRPQPSTRQPLQSLTYRPPQPPPRDRRDRLARTTHNTTISSSHYNVSTTAFSTYFEPLLPRLLLQSWLLPPAPSSSDTVMRWLETVEDAQVDHELEPRQRGRRDALSRIRELEAHHGARREEKK